MVAVSGRPADAWETARDIGPLADSEGFASYAALDEAGRQEVQRLVRGRGEGLFASFPDREVLHQLRPVPQDAVNIRITPGLVLRARFDLTIDKSSWPRPIIVELKSGSWREDYRKDLRFYALAYLLREGQLPGQVVCCSGLDAIDAVETVNEDTVEAALRRVEALLPRLVELATGAAPTESPNPLCPFCPALDGCSSGQSWSGPGEDIDDLENHDDIPAPF